MALERQLSGSYGESVQIAHHLECQVAIIQELLTELHQALDRNLLESADDMLQRLVGTEIDLVFGQLGHRVVVAFQGEEDIPFEQ